MKFRVPLILVFLAALAVACVAQSQSGQALAASGVALPKTTEVTVIQTARQGVTRQQLMAIMPSEIRETVKLYLDGKIRQWYSRGDGKGVVLLIDVKTEDEARAIMESLPLRTIDGSRIYSGRPPGAAPGIDWRRSAAVTLRTMARL